LIEIVCQVGIDWLTPSRPAQLSSLALAGSGEQSMRCIFDQIENTLEPFGTTRVESRECPDFIGEGGYP
jgi:hypothetical protein